MSTQNEDHGPVEALWVGPPASLSDGTQLETGVTKRVVGYHEAHESDNWKPVGAPSKGGLVDAAQALGIHDAEHLSVNKLREAIADAQANPNGPAPDPVSKGADS